jgi:hypothetical protein
MNISLLKEKLGWIPDASTFFQVFKRVKSEELPAYLYARLMETRQLEEKQISIERKTIWGSSRRSLL